MFPSFLEKIAEIKLFELSRLPVNLEVPRSSRINQPRGASAS